MGSRRTALPVLPRMGSPRSTHRCARQRPTISPPGPAFSSAQRRRHIFTTGGSLTAEEAEQFDACYIGVVRHTIDKLVTQDDHLHGARLEDGTEIGLDAFAVMPRMIARAKFLEGLGLAVIPHPSGTGDHIPIDATGRTAVAGVWAAGNVTDIAAQVGAFAAA